MNFSNLVTQGAEGYEPAERAYVINYSNMTGQEYIDFKIEAGKENPIVNPAFIIKNWGSMDVTLKIDGIKIEQGKEFRHGYRKTPYSGDLIVWIKKKTEKPVRFTFSPSLR